MGTQTKTSLHRGPCPSGGAQDSAQNCAPEQVQKQPWAVGGLGGILLEILFPPPAQELHQDPLLCPGISLLWFK